VKVKSVGGVSVFQPDGNFKGEASFGSFLSLYGVESLVEIAIGVDPSPLTAISASASSSDGRRCGAGTPTPRECGDEISRHEHGVLGEARTDALESGRAKGRAVRFPRVGSPRADTAGAVLGRLQRVIQNAGRSDDRRQSRPVHTGAASLLRDEDGVSALAGAGIPDHR